MRIVRWWHPQFNRDASQIPVVYCGCKLYTEKGEKLPLRGRHVFRPVQSKNLRFLSLQAWHDALIQVKFDVEEHTLGSLFRCKFPVDQWLGWVWDSPKFKTRDVGLAIKPVLQEHAVTRRCYACDFWFHLYSFSQHFKMYWHLLSCLTSFVRWFI